MTPPIPPLVLGSPLMAAPRYEYAYLHGFASGPEGRKAQHFARWMERRGLQLHRPDLNQPSFERLTLSASLESLLTLALGRSSFCRLTWQLAAGAGGEAASAA